MVYQIKPYSYEQAKKLNVEIKPSTRKDIKLMFIKIKNIYVQLEIFIIMTNRHICKIME